MGKYYRALFVRRAVFKLEAVRFDYFPVCLQVYAAFLLICVPRQLSADGFVLQDMFAFLVGKVVGTFILIAAFVLLQNAGLLLIRRSLVAEVVIGGVHIAIAGLFRLQVLFRS